MSKSLFDLIAPVYGWFFRYQIRNYQRRVKDNILFFQANDKVLDIGCGTGALAFVLDELGCEVTGIDSSAEMIKQARRLNQNSKVNFMVGDVSSLSLPKYDLVTASYVLHGLQKDQRQMLYAEMKQLARKRVIIMDYNQRRGFLTSLIEWLERGDYFNFIKSAEKEMAKTFLSVQVIQTGKRAAWYVCEIM